MIKYKISNIIEQAQNLIKDLEDLQIMIENVNSTRFFKKVNELKLSSRAYIFTKNNDIEYIGELIQLTPYEILRSPNVGRKTVQEIKNELARIGLHLGTDVPLEVTEKINNLKKSKL